MKRRQAQPRGFTLIELLIYMAIVTTALMVFTNFFADVTHAAARAKSSDEVRENGRLILTRVVQEIRNARCIDTTGSVLGNDHGTLRIIRDDCTAPTSTATFSWSSDSVLYTDGAATPVDLSTSRVRVTTLRFDYNPAGHDVLIALQLEPAAANSSPSEQLNLTTNVVPRFFLY